jgi:radical SAM superfamily enzyme YgiQ (UPF0313 family)
MKVLLVNPPYRTSVYKASKVAATIDMPLSIAYIAAVLEKSGTDVEILDANALNLSMDETADRVAGSGAGIIGITATTTIMPLVYSLSEKIKERDKNATIVIGGPHVTFLPERTLRECAAIDIIVRGEGEMTMLEMVNRGGNPEGVNGTTYRKRNRIVNNPDRNPIEDLDSLPFPARHLLPLHLYNSGSIMSSGHDGKEYASMITARGCPNKCTFCSSSHFWGTRVRFRSPENVVQEIEFLVEKYGTREIFFRDDTFTFSPLRTERICDLILEKGIRIKWSCYARAKSITPRLLHKMKEAGCSFLNFGVESGNQHILDRIKKNMQLGDAERAIRLARMMHVNTYASFILGLPGDTEQTVEDTISFAIRLSPDIAQFFIPSPFPGTEMTEEAVKNGWINDVESWDEISEAACSNFRNEALTNRQIHILVSRAYRRFYIRPGFVMQSLVRLMMNPGMAKKYALGFFAVSSLM